MALNSRSTCRRSRRSRHPTCILKDVGRGQRTLLILLAVQSLACPSFVRAAEALADPYATRFQIKKGAYRGQYVEDDSERNAVILHEDKSSVDFANLAIHDGHAKGHLDYDNISDLYLFTEFPVSTNYLCMDKLGAHAFLGVKLKRPATFTNQVSGATSEEPWIYAEVSSAEPNSGQKKVWGRHLLTPDDNAFLMTFESHEQKKRSAIYKGSGRLIRKVRLRLEPAEKTCVVKKLLKLSTRANSGELLYSLLKRSCTNSLVHVVEDCVRGHRLGKAVNKALSPLATFPATAPSLLKRLGVLEDEDLKSPHYWHEEVIQNHDADAAEIVTTEELLELKRESESSSRSRQNH